MARQGHHTRRGDSFYRYMVYNYQLILLYTIYI